MFIHQVSWHTVWDVADSFTMGSGKGFLAFMWQASMLQVFLSSYIVFISLNHLYSCSTLTFSPFSLLSFFPSFAHQYLAYVSCSWLIFLPRGGLVKLLLPLPDLINASSSQLCYPTSNIYGIMKPFFIERFRDLTAF